MTQEPLLLARDITRKVKDGHNQITILNQITLDMKTGERTVLLGPSGSGKSTLLHILGALDPHYTGSVSIAGQKLEGLSDKALAAFRNRTLGFIFQSYNLLGHLSVLENVLLPARFSPNRVDHDHAYKILGSVGLFDKAHRKPLTLSGGERQRVAIARALYTQPRLVLCDEPTGNLDSQTSTEILAVFDQLTAEGVTLLIATHDEAIAKSAHRILNLREGRLI